MPDHRITTIELTKAASEHIVANKQTPCLYTDEARIKFHRAISIVRIVNRSVRGSYSSEDLAKRMQGDYCNNANSLGKMIIIFFTMPVFHSKFVHDDRLLMNHVQQQYYPKLFDTSLTMDSILLESDLLLRIIVS